MTKLRALGRTNLKLGDDDLQPCLSNSRGGLLARRGVNDKRQVRHNIMQLRRKALQEVERSRGPATHPKPSKTKATIGGSEMGGDVTMALRFCGTHISDYAIYASSRKVFATGVSSLMTPA